MRTKNTQTNDIKGREFENYIASLLAKDGWEICMNRDKGKLDEGIDIIAKREGITALIQCKYRGANAWKLGDESYNKLFASAKVYQIEHPQEKVHTSVVTNGKFYQDTKDKARILGIELVEAKMTRIGV